MDAPASFVCDARRKRCRTQCCQTRRKRPHTLFVAKLKQAQHITALSRHRRDELNDDQIQLPNSKSFCVVSYEASGPMDEVLGRFEAFRVRSKHFVDSFMRGKRRSIFRVTLHGFVRVCS